MSSYSSNKFICYLIKVNHAFKSVLIWNHVQDLNTLLIYLRHWQKVLCVSIFLLHSAWPRIGWPPNFYMTRCIYVLHLHPFFLNSIHKGKVCFKACNLICWQLARVITFLELINSSRAYISMLWKTNLPTSLARYQVIWIYPLGNSLLIYCIFCQTCN